LARDRRTELRSSSSLHTSKVSTTQTSAPVKSAAGAEVASAPVCEAAVATAVTDIASNPTDNAILVLFVIVIPFASTRLKDTTDPRDF
jgi:phage gp46-like protein